MTEQITGKHYIRGDYVITGVKNAFNDRASFWITKRGYTLAVYCFSAMNRREVERQITDGMNGYIALFETRLNALNDGGTK